MIRRYAVALVAMVAVGLLSVAPAEAGGTGGAVGVKKNANVVIKNTSTSPYYVLVVPESLVKSKKFGEPGTVGWATKLGAALVNPGATLTYPVPAGPGGIFVADPKAVSKDPKAQLPEPLAEAGYSVKKGKSVTKTIKAGPVVE